MQTSNGLPFPLGVTLAEGGANVAVSSEVADAIEVCLFDDAGEEQRIELPARTAHIWHGWLPEVRAGQRYGLRVHGPWSPHQGLRCNPAKLLLDPHARAISGSVAWGPEVFGHDLQAADRENALDSAAAMPRCIAPDTFFDWGDDRRRSRSRRRSSTRPTSKG
jgi:glycogen operon protein